MISKLEEAGAAMVRSGAAEAWMGDADERIEKVASVANGCLFDILLRATGFPDRQCAQLLRSGLCLRLH